MIFYFWRFYSNLPFLYLYFYVTASYNVCYAARVYTDVKYKKQPWGLVKSFITKNSWSGIEDNFRQLGE